jgi:adenine-specific DNA-methyltransferase
LEFIYNEVVNFSFLPDQFVVADLFAGTGVVSNYFAQNGHKIIVNDILFSNYVVYKAWFGTEIVNTEKLLEILKKYNELNSVELVDNYFSKTYGSKYFSNNDAKKIGFIRDDIEINKSHYNEREYAALVSILIYAVDKIANTVGHFEHYLSKTPIDTNFQLQLLDLPTTKTNVEIFQKDANILVKEIKCDVAYVDPPYNARQYVNFYHVLENIATWEKPEIFEGISMKFKRNHLKSGYSTTKAKGLFVDLINNLDCKLIVVSYNNTFHALSSASNNKIQEQELIDVLKSKGEVIIKETDYKCFNAGKTELKGHKEKLYICQVQRSRKA